MSRLYIEKGARKDELENEKFLQVQPSKNLIS